MIRSVVSCAVLLAALNPAVAPGAIMGFEDFSQFEVNQSDPSTPPAVSPATGTIQLTSRQDKQLRSIFHSTPQGVGKFAASFTYRAVGGGGSPSFGAAFVLHNDPDGADAIGAATVAYGYSGIANSMAVTLELENRASATHSGLYTGGVIGGGALDTSPLNLRSGQAINVDLTYNGALLSLRMVNPASMASFSASYLLDIPAIVGGPTAYVGFTANTNTNTEGGFFPTNADQFISDFQFEAVPEPECLALLAPLFVAVSALRRRPMVAPAFQRCFSTRCADDASNSQSDPVSGLSSAS
jgi:hypothetical protein